MPTAPPRRPRVPLLDLLDDAREQELLDADGLTREPLIASDVPDTCSRQRAEDHVDGLMKELAGRKATKTEGDAEFERIMAMPDERLDEIEEAYRAKTSGARKPAGESHGVSGAGLHPSD